MSETVYTYDITNDFPLGRVNPSRLKDEINSSQIVPSFYINTNGGTTSLGVVSGGSIDIVFKAELSASEKTILDGDATWPAGGLIGSHDNSVTPPEIQPVKVIQPVNSDGIPLSIPKSSGTNYILNDRDVLMRTGILDAWLAAEDLKINPSDFSQYEWGEAKLVGVYKRSDPSTPNGEHELCSDQDDADQNATLSVYDYQARHNGDPVSYEIKGGAVYVDLHKDGLGSNKSDMECHRIYVVAAPDIPSSYGGSVAFFDGYLAPWAQNWLETGSSDAFRVEYNPSAPPASIIRVFIFYHPGAKVTHIMRFNLYRHIGY